MSKIKILFLFACIIILFVSGCSVETLYSAIDNGCPVVVWASIDMEEIVPDSVICTDEETEKNFAVRRRAFGLCQRLASRKCFI